MEDIINQKFGKLAVIGTSTKRSREGSVLYECKCECGKITYVAARHLRSGHTKSCGCTRKEKFSQNVKTLKKDLTGKKFGRLTAIKYIKSDKNNKSIWLCKCECSNTKEVLAESLLSGNTTSCGCISKEQLQKVSERNFIDNTNTAIMENILKDNTSNITESGVKGVGWDKRRERWRAYIMFKRKYYHLGYFTELEEAIKIRKRAEEELFKEFLDWYYNMKGIK